MATRAHAAYCLETLTAELEDRENLSYQQILDLWEQYEHHRQREEDSTHFEHQQGVVLHDGIEVEDNESFLDGLDEDEAEEEEEETLEPPEPEPAPEPRRTTRSTLQLPSISRLQALSPASSSSSSSASATSSSAALGSNSKSSSNSSFFSFGRSKQASPVLPKPEAHPLFITWNTISRRSGHRSLRGCIGTFDQKELASGLSEYALLAAFKDNRFPPIGLSDLRALACSVTLLTNFTTCSSATDWTIGVHGIRIAFSYGHQRLGATYLPDVALEQGWSKEETLVSLMRKAGWSGRNRDWREAFERGKGGVVRYEGRKMTLSWDEWARWREWTRALGFR